MPAVIGSSGIVEVNVRVNTGSIIAPVPNAVFGARGPQGPSGSAGPSGPSGADGADGATGPKGDPGLVWKNEWDFSTEYYPGDVVQADGSSYVLLDTAPTVPAVNIYPPGNSAPWWDLVAAKGDDGGGGSDFSLGDLPNPNAEDDPENHRYNPELSYPKGSLMQYSDGLYAAKHDIEGKPVPEVTQTWIYSGSYNEFSLDINDIGPDERLVVALYIVDTDFAGWPESNGITTAGWQGISWYGGIVDGHGLYLSKWDQAVEDRAESGNVIFHWTADNDTFINCTFMVWKVNHGVDYIEYDMRGWERTSGDEYLRMSNDIYWPGTQLTGMFVNGSGNLPYTYFMDHTTTIGEPLDNSEAAVVGDRRLEYFPENGTIDVYPEDGNDSIVLAKFNIYSGEWDSDVEEENWNHLASVPRSIFDLREVDEVNDGQTIVWTEDGDEFRGRYPRSFHSNETLDARDWEDTSPNDVFLHITTGDLYKRGSNQGDWDLIANFTLGGNIPLKASAILHSTSLTPAPEDTITQLNYKGLSYTDPDTSIPSWYESWGTYTWGDVWDQEPNTHVILYCPDFDGGEAKYCKVTETGFEPVPVSGGTLVHVSCGGGGNIFGAGVVWVGVNFDSNLFGGISEYSDANFFFPVTVPDSSVALTGTYTGNIAGVTSLDFAMHALDELTTGGGSPPPIPVKLAAGIHELEGPGVYIAENGPQITMPPAADNLGAEIAIQVVSGEVTLLPYGTEGVQYGSTLAEISYSSASLPAGTLAVWRAGGSDEFGVNLWWLIALTTPTQETSPILHADWGLHHYTNDVYPISEIDPADDLSAWEDGGGPEFWGVPTDSVSRLWIHDEIDRTLTGIWVYDPTGGTSTIERAADADTTAKLHDKLIITTTRRERSAGGLAENPEWRPIDSHVKAIDPTDDMGTAVWWVDELIDTETFNTITGYLESQIEDSVKVIDVALYPGVGRPLIMATDEVDGTGTVVRLLEVNYDAPASGYIPAGWQDAGLGELPMSAFATLLSGGLGAPADSNNPNTTIIPGGDFTGVYRPVVNEGVVEWVTVNAPVGRTVGRFDYSGTTDTFGASWLGFRTEIRFETILPKRISTALEPSDLGYDAETGLIDESHIPESIARDTEISSAILTHNEDEEAHSSIQGRLDTAESAFSDHEARIETLEAIPIKSYVVGGQNSGTPISATTTPTSLLDSTITLPASGAGTLFEIEAMINLVQNSGGALAHTIGVYLGGTLLFSVVGPGLSSSAVTRLIRFQGVIRLDSATLADGYGDCTYSANVQSGQGLDQTVAFGSNVTFDLRGSMAAATATQSLQLRSLSIKRTIM